MKKVSSGSGVGGLVAMQFNRWYMDSLHSTRDSSIGMTWGRSLKSTVRHLA